MGTEMTLQEEALLNFLLDIDCLDQLSPYLSGFNVFDVLKIARTEIRHSNVLAWLLDPNESHGLHDFFMRALFTSLVKKGVVENEPAIRLLTMDRSDFSIFREWKNIDILAVSETQKTVVCIENKIDSLDSNNQLDKYVII